MSTERHQIGGDADRVLDQMRQALYALGIPTNPSYPNVWSGVGGGASYGVTQKVDVHLQKTPQGSFVELRVQAEFESTAIILFIVCYLFCLPLGLVFGFLAWQGYQDRQRMIFESTWAPVAGSLVQSQWGTPAGLRQ